MSDHPLVSVIIPVTESHESFSALNQEYLGALKDLKDAYEVIYVLDVQDASIAKLVAEQVEQYDFAKSITLPRSYGDCTALKAGLRAASGEKILLLPDYPQVESADITKVLAELDGCDMTIGQRDRSGESFLNKIHGRVFNTLVSRFASSIVQDVGCEVRAFTREVAEEVWFYGNQHRYLPILADRMGFKVKGVDVRQARQNRRRSLRSPGQYMVSLLDILNVVFLTRFTKRPLRFFGLVGLTMTALGAAVVLYVVGERLFFDVGLASRPALVVGALMLVVGLQVTGIGLIGEIVIFSRARDLPEYYVKEVVTGRADSTRRETSVNADATLEQADSRVRAGKVSGL